MGQGASSGKQHAGSVGEGAGSVEQVDDSLGQAPSSLGLAPSSGEGGCFSGEAPCWSEEAACFVGGGGLLTEKNARFLFTIRCFPGNGQGSVKNLTNLGGYFYVSDV